MARDGARAEGVKLGWLASFVLSVVMGVLLFVTTQEMRSGHEPTVVALPSAADCSSQQANLPTQIAQATKLLEASGLPLPTPVEEVQGADRLRYVHRKYDISMPALRLDELKQRLQVLNERDPCVSIDAASEAGGARVRIGIDEVLTHTLTLRWIVPTPQRVRVAILVEDLGADLLSAREITALDAPVDLAITAGRPFAKEVAELAHLFQREVLLSLSVDADDQSGESVVTPAAPTEDSVHQRLDQGLAAVPYVVGLMQPSNDLLPPMHVLSWLKLHQLFLVEGAVPLDKSAQQLAAALGIALAPRRLVLDAVPDEAAVRERLDALVKLARERGSAIGVAHPHTSTITALRMAVPQWRDAGVEVVPVSAVVQVPTLAPE